MDEGKRETLKLDLQRALVRESLARRSQLRRNDTAEEDNPVPYRCAPAVDSIIQICTERLSQCQHDAKALLTRASAYLRKEMHDEALRDCEALLTAEPDNIQGLYVQGCTYEKLGMVESSLHCFSRVLELDPSHTNAALSQAACLNRLGQFTEACEVYAQALAVGKEPRTPLSESKHTSKSTSVSTTEKHDTQVMRVSLVSAEHKQAAGKYLQGCAAKKQGDFTLAVRLLTECLQVEPAHFKALFNRGFAYDKLGDLEAALKDYTAALEVEPRNAYAYYNRGILLQRLGKHYVAFEDFTAAIQLDSSKAEFFNNRGYLSFQMKKYEEAVDDFTAALSIEPKHLGARLRRAKCYERLSLFIQARNDYELSWKQDPTGPKTPLRLARVLIASGRFQEANEVLERAKASDRSSAKWWNLKAEAGAGLDDVSQALIAFSHSLTMDPRNTRTRLNRALVLTKHSSHSEAIEDCDKVLAFDPHNTSALIIKTEAYLRLGKVGRALAVAKSEETSPRLWTLRGYAEALLGDLKAAIASFSAGLRLDSDLRDCLHNRGVAYTLLKNYAAALADFSAEIQLAPSSELAYFCRGYVYEHLEAADQAITDYEAALRLEPKGSPEFLLIID
jgi:tetratricopeptide (TPR) repeat protein